MKKNNGITMISLVIYVAVMTIVLGIMGSIITTFYSNTDELQGNVQEIVEFNKFNAYFLKEVKAINNRVDHISEDDNYILFTSGNSFSFSNNTIYFNNIKVCEGIKELKFVLEHDVEDSDEEYSIIKATLNLGNFKKTLKYKLENIY